MITFTIELVCDDCLEIYTGQPGTLPLIGPVADEARDKGWIVEDDHCVCPTCADGLRESRELDRVDREIDIQRNDFPGKEAA